MAFHKGEHGTHMYQIINEATESYDVLDMAWIQ